MMRRHADRLRRRVPGRLPALALALGLTLGLTGTAALAQEAAAAPPNWRITPSVTVEETYTDNVSPGSASKKSDFVTRLAPGIQIEGASARASGKLDYRWQHYAYAGNGALNNQQQAMTASGKLELVEKWLFLDAQNNIAQRPTSVFGTQGVGNELVNANRTQTSSYQWSPYIQGALGDLARYQLRYANAHTQAGSGTLSGAGASTQSWNGTLAGTTPLSWLGWSALLDRQRSEGRGVLGELQSNRLRGTLEYHAAPQLLLFLSLGREADNYGNAAWQRRTTRGYGGNWSPTERTQVAFKKERRSFGDSGSLDLTHRTALTAWRFSNSKDVTLPSPQLAQNQTPSAFELLNLQLTSAIPDPVLRAQEARNLLQRLGLPTDPTLSSLLTSQVYLSHRQDASVALTGANNVVTFALDRSDSEKLGAVTGLADDFALAPRIRQSGRTLSWAHKISPLSALTLNTRASRNTGLGGSGTGVGSPDVGLHSWSLLFTTKLGAKTAATVGVRQTRSDRPSGTGAAVGTNTYDENAITGSLQIAF